MEDYLRRERAAKLWIEQTLSIKLSDRFHQDLRTGVVLCQLMQKLQPRSIPHIHLDPDAAFLQIKWNITFFLEALVELGVPSAALFSEQQLYHLLAPPKTILALELLSHHIGKLSADAKSPMQEIYKELSPNPEDNQYGSIRDEEALLLIVNQVNELRNKYLRSTETGKWARTAHSGHRKMGSISFTATYRLDKRIVVDLAPFKPHAKLFIPVQALIRMFVQRRKFKKAIREEAYRINVVKEILTTEQLYANNLQILIEVSIFTISPFPVSISFRSVLQFSGKL
jgi:hypothetical protein